MWKLVFTNVALKDLDLIAASKYRKQAYRILTILEEDPFIPPYEKLVGELEGVYSRRIYIQHRVVYQLYKKEKIVKIIRMYTHYGK